MPSWPEVMGIYAINLPKMGYGIEWILPNKVGMFQKVETRSFFGAILNLVPYPISKNKILMFTYILPYQLRIFWLSVHIIRIKKVDFILVRDDVWSGITAIILKWLFGIPLIFNYSFPSITGALDSYREGRIGFAKLAFSEIEDLLLKKFVLKSAELILPISDLMADQLEEIGLKKERMLPVPLGVEPKIFKPRLDRKSMRANLSFLDGDFVFVYIGSITKMRGLDLIIDAFKEVEECVKNVKLIFVGSGDGINDLKINAKRNSIEKDVLFTGQISYFDVPNYLEASDVALSILKPLPCVDVCSPCKLFEYMLMKKPVIANEEILEHRKVVSSSKCGLLVKYDKNDIYTAMLNLISMKKYQRDTFEKIGSNGYEWVIENRTFQKMAGEIDERLSNMTSTVRPKWQP